jgi:hypothetical protein
MICENVGLLHSAKKKYESLLNKIDSDKYEISQKYI